MKLYTLARFCRAAIGWLFCVAWALLWGNSLLSRVTHAAGTTAATTAVSVPAASVSIPSAVSLAELASRQLIVLFDATKSGAPSPTAMIAATTNPSSNPLLYNALGQPQQAARLLEGITSSAQLL